MSAFSDRIRDQKNKGLYKAADFEGGKEVTHIISHLLEAVEMFGKEVDILNFSDTARQLQINQTNAEFLLDAFGDDPEKRAGKPVTLYSFEYDIKGEKKPGIRLKKADTAAAEASTARARARLTDGKAAMDDEIPFRSREPTVSGAMDRLAPDTLERLVKLLGMLGSAHDGERAAAGLKAHELVRCHLLAAPASPPRLGWRDKLTACAAHQHCLNSRERAFVLSLTRWRGTPTEKQLASLERIYENLP